MNQFLNLALKLQYHYQNNHVRTPNQTRVKHPHSKRNKRRIRPCWESGRINREHDLHSLKVVNHKIVVVAGKTKNKARVKFHHNI